MSKKKEQVPRGTMEQKQLKLIGRAFQNRRLDLKLQIKQVAERAGFSALTVSKLEKGELENIRIGSINAIGAAIGLKITFTIENYGRQEDI